MSYEKKYIKYKKKYIELKELIGGGGINLRITTDEDTLKKLFEKSIPLRFDIKNDDTYKYKYHNNNNNKTYGYEPHNRYIDFNDLNKILPDNISIKNCNDNNYIKKSDISNLINNLKNNKSLTDKSITKNIINIFLKKNENKNENEKNFCNINDNSDLHVAYIKINKNNILIVFNKMLSDKIINDRKIIWENLEEPPGNTNSNDFYNF